jgi:tetratricopeptide (TPR) repeat protein
MKFLNSIYEKKFLFFLCISFLLYGNTLKNGYAIDDQFVTENNYTNKGLKSIPKIFSSYYAENDGKNNYEYRPIVKVSFAIEHQFFGVRPWVGHLINIILYAVCLLLLFKVLRLIFYNHTLFFSICITVFFAVLPIHTEVVASLKNRDILLCFIFCMLIVIHLDSFFKTKNYLFLFYSLLLAIISFLTKYDVLPFLAIAPIVLYKKHKFKILPIIITSITFTGSYFLSKTVKQQLLNKTAGERIYKFYENPLFFEHEYVDRISTAFNCVGHYFKMSLFPTNMSCYYGYNTIDLFNFFSPYAILGVVLIIVMIFYFFKLIKTEHPVWFAIVFFGMSISMYLNVLKIVPGIVADRFLFSASIGFAIFIVYLLFHIINKNLNPDSFKKTNSNFKMISITILFFYSFMTISRNAEWKDRVTLYGHDIENRPTSAALNLLYSNEVLVSLNNPKFFLTGQEKNKSISKAIVSLNNVLKIDSLNTTALNNLAFIKQKVNNDFAGAIPYYKKALIIDSTKFEVQFNLCYCLFKTYQLQEAQALILKLFTSDSKNQQVLDLMSYILIENKKTKEGIQIFKALSDEQPNNNSINIILGNFYIADFDSINAKTYYTKALDNDKNNPQLIKMIARLSE